MSTAFTNRFMFSVNTNSSEVTLEFFLEEPDFDPNTTQINSVTTTSVSKLIMSKSCADNLLAVLAQALSGTKEAEPQHE